MLQKCSSVLYYDNFIIVNNLLMLFKTWMVWLFGLRFFYVLRISIISFLIKKSFLWHQVKKKSAEIQIAGMNTNYSLTPVKYATVCNACKM